jgi:16S rRNA (guanine966-N2)-methyltransferase
MRVIAGIWRGRPLLAPRGSAARPTTDRVKGALFSLIGARIVAAEVADLCCGSGGLGIEALSRGAARAHFVDVDPRALRGTEENLRRLGADPERYRLRRSDAVRWLERWRGGGEGHLVVLADPPYGGPLAGAIWARLLDLGAAGRLLVAVVEHPPELRLEAPGTAGPVSRRRRYGNSCLSILEA